MRLQVKASPERLRQLQKQLEDWLESAQASDTCDTDEATATAGVLVAFYPVPGSRS
jgi:hypothetical protein